MSTTEAPAATDTETRTVKVHRVYINATPEAIWQAIVDPEWNGRYGYHMAGTYDLRPGGRYAVAASPELLEMGMPDEVLEGEVIEVDAPRKLVQTWRMRFAPEQIAEPLTTLTYEIVPEPGKEGITRLTITHDLTDAPIHEEQTSPTDLSLVEGGGGWSWVLSDLKSLLERGEASA